MAFLGFYKESVTGGPRLSSSEKHQISFWEANQQVIDSKNRMCSWNENLEEIVFLIPMNIQLQFLVLLSIYPVEFNPLLALNWGPF